MGLYAQSDFSQEDWIRQHVYTLASDSMAGRQTGSIYADKAAQYIKQEFENIVEKLCANLPNIKQHKMTKNRKKILRILHLCLVILICYQHTY